jgi:hypothetical protein
LGISGFPLEQHFPRVGFLATDHCWVKHAWKFMSSSGFTIQSSALDPSLKLRRGNDSFLMELFLSSNLGSDALRRLNRCRLFLKVTTLSDITTGDGNKITKSAWQGVQDITRPTHYVWPAQSSPPAADSEIWRSALQSTVCSNSRILRSQVGAWTDTNLTDHWMWYFSPSLERLYRHQPQGAPGTWSFYPRAPGRPSCNALMSFIHENSIHSNDVPHDLHPATINLQGTRYKLTGYTTAPIRQEQETTSLRPTLQQEIDLLDSSAKWALQNFSCIDNGETIARAIQDSTALAISDGSYKDSCGTASLVIERVNKVGRIRADNVVPSSPEDQSAYRSELSGLYGIVLAVSWPVRSMG